MSLSTRAMKATLKGTITSLNAGDEKGEAEIEVLLDGKMMSDIPTQT